MVTLGKDFPGEMSELYVKEPCDYNQNGSGFYRTILQNNVVLEIMDRKYKSSNKRQHIPVL